MRVLHVFDHSIPLQSGYSFRSRAILLEQRRRGWETVHVTGGKQGSVEMALQEVGDLAFYRTPPLGPLLGRLPIINQVAISDGLERRVRQVIAETAPDVVHAHSPVLNGLAALRAARKADLPVVYEIRAFWEDAAVDHGTTAENSLRYRATHALESYVARRVDAVTTICEGLRRDLLERGIEESHITVIPNAVDVERFDYDPPRDAELEAQYDLRGKPVVGFIGSFYAYEGITDLIEVFPRVLEAIPDLRLLLVGGGPCHDEVLSLIGQHGLQDAVICTGRVPHEQVSRYYSLVDAFCYPRLPMRLTELVTPLKPLEAMAQGKIVIASDVGGHRELIEDGVTGFLFQRGSRDALAAAIVQGFSDRAKWPQLKSAGRHFVETERCWPNSVARYAGVYANARSRSAKSQ